MPMFLGEYQPNITAGERLALPKKLREQVRSNAVILTRGFEECVLGYNPDDWREEALKQEELSISDAKTRKLKRYLYSQAAEVSFDKQGRFIVPVPLKTYARLGESVTVIGAGDHFEIWNSGLWKEHLAVLEKEVGTS